MDTGRLAAQRRGLRSSTGMRTPRTSSPFPVMEKSTSCSATRRTCRSLRTWTLSGVISSQVGFHMVRLQAERTGSHGVRRRGPQTPHRSQVRSHGVSPSRTAAGPPSGLPSGCSPSPAMRSSISNPRGSSTRSPSRPRTRCRCPSRWSRRASHPTRLRGGGRCGTPEPWAPRRERPRYPARFRILPSDPCGTDCRRDRAAVVRHTCGMTIGGDSSGVAVARAPAGPGRAGRVGDPLEPMTDAAVNVIILATPTNTRAGARRRAAPARLTPPVPRSGTLSQADLGVLQTLAHEVAEIAALPVQQETDRLWKALNGLRPARPMAHDRPDPLARDGRGWRARPADRGRDGPRASSRRCAGPSTAGGTCGRTWSSSPSSTSPRSSAAPASASGSRSRRSPSTLTTISSATTTSTSSRGRRPWKHPGAGRRARRRGDGARSRPGARGLRRHPRRADAGLAAILRAVGRHRLLARRGARAVRPGRPARAHARHRGALTDARLAMLDQLEAQGLLGQRAGAHPLHRRLDRRAARPRLRPERPRTKDLWTLRHGADVLHGLAGHVQGVRGRLRGPLVSRASAWSTTAAATRCDRKMDRGAAGSPTCARSR